MHLICQEYLSLHHLELPFPTKIISLKERFAQCCHMIHKTTDSVHISACDLKKSTCSQRILIFPEKSQSLAQKNSFKFWKRDVSFSPRTKQESETETETFFFSHSAPTNKQTITMSEPHSFSMLLQNSLLLSLSTMHYTISDSHLYTNKIFSDPNWERTTGPISTGSFPGWFDFFFRYCHHKH